MDYEDVWELDSCILLIIGIRYAYPMFIYKKMSIASQNKILTMPLLRLLNKNCIFIPENCQQKKYTDRRQLRENRGMQIHNLAPFK